jgi:membrane associated rhomboid family serine protease
MPTLTNGVKYILIANIAVFILTALSSVIGTDISNYLALYYIKSDNFRPLQFVTYMFVHAGFLHIFFNMYALIMFGSAIESIWGTKRFTFYYMVTGIGAGVVNMIVTHYQLMPFNEALEAFYANPTPDTFTALGATHPMFDEAAVSELAQSWREGIYSESMIIEHIEPRLQNVASAIYGIPIVGASGAVFGLLLAFGIMFPNLKLQIIFIPIGIPAKYFVLLYGVAELFFGVNNFSGDNIAHFAHLGGMLVGLLLLLWWQRHPQNNFFN